MWSKLTCAVVVVVVVIVAVKTQLSLSVKEFLLLHKETCAMNVFADGLRQKGVEAIDSVL